MKLCIADNLNLMRQKSGYSLEALAEIISVSRQTIAKWELGDSYPDLMNCMKLASLYKVSLDELLKKPMRENQNTDFLSLDNNFGGVIDVSEDGTIRIPDTVLEMFDIHPGEKVLLLADKKQGIAVIKCSYF